MKELIDFFIASDTYSFRYIHNNLLIDINNILLVYILILQCWKLFRICLINIILPFGSLQSETDNNKTEIDKRRDSFLNHIYFKYECFDLIQIWKRCVHQEGIKRQCMLLRSKLLVLADYIEQFFSVCEK